MATKMRYKKSFKETEVEKKVSVPMIFSEFIVKEMPDYYSVYHADFNTREWACCPLHDEDTPSLKYYEETNSFFCFGCRVGGNSARLYRLFYNRMFDANITQEQAVDFLYKYFIEGKEIVNLPSAKVEEKKKNNIVDVIRLNKYRIDLEELISFDKNVSQEQKEEIWELLDKIDLLLSKEMLDVNECENYLKNEVNNILNK